MVGRTILHYEILELLGHGASGATYKALDTRLDTPRTLKFLHPGLTSVEAARGHLIREARAQARLLHPNVATLMSMEEFEDSMFLVLQYVDGMTLDGYLAHLSLSAKERLGLLVQVAAALDAAHSLDIVHRDIKPQNILIDAEGTVKVTDFGLAKAIGATTMSASGEIKGTVSYMPPEAFRGEMQGKAGDVWALGVLAYELLEDKRLFGGDTFETIAYQIVSEPIPSLSEDVVRHFPGIDQFLRRSLERNPATRIRDGVAAFDALEPIAQQAGVAANLPQHVRRYATRRRTRRIRRVLLRASLVALGAMAGLLLYRQMEVAPPDLIREWTWTSRYFSPTWNGHGTKLAYYDEYGEPGEIIIRDMVDLDAPDEHHMVEGAVDLSHLAWSPTESLIAVSSDQGLFLYRPDTRHTLRLLPDVMEEISWEPGGESLVICCHPGGGTYGLGVISTSAALEDSGSNAPVVEWISVSGVHGVHLYDPVFILDGSRIAFILLDGSVHRGLWTVSRSGGQAQQIDRSGVTTTIDLRAWNLDWDESRSEILFSNRDGPDLFRMEIGPDGIALDTVEEIGIGRAVSEFDYAPASDKLALFALGSRYWIGELAREGIQESSQFRIVLDTFERDDLLQMNNLALSAGAIRQVYVATLMVDRSSMGLVELDLHTGNLEPLLQSEGEFERAWQPQIDDRTGSPRVVFIGDKGGGSCVWLLEANRTYRLCEAWEAPSSPSWSGDGQSVYYAGKQRQEDRRPNRVVRVSLIEGLSGERVSQKDVILNAAEVHTRSISQPLSDSSGGFLAFQGSGDSLFAFDMRARTYVYLANGRNLSQDPSRRDLFFLDGSLIFRLRDWVTAFEKRMIPEAVALLPPHTTPAWPLRALAVSTDHIYVLLREPTPANLLLFSLGR